MSHINQAPYFSSSLRAGVGCVRGSVVDSVRADLKLAAHRVQRGFTMIELMIVVAVIAILAAIAIPNYNDYVKRGQIVDGLVPLADMGGKLEQYFQDNRTFVGACATGTVAPMPVTTARFVYSCNLAASTYTVTATGQGGMAGFVFTLNQNGARSTTGTAPGWTAGTNCWSARKVGSC